MQPKARYTFSLLLLLLLLTLSANANLIVNGSFEIGNYNSLIGFQRLLPGSTDLTGWTIGGSGVDWHVGTPNPDLNPALINANFGPAKDGSLVIDLNLDGDAAGTISQTFSTIVGTVYKVSFYLAGDSFFTNPRAVQVDVGGGSWVFTQNVSPQFSKDWGLKTFQFTATDTQSTLMFSSPDITGFWGPLLDDVRVEAVPEPSTWFLVILTLVTLATVRRIEFGRITN